MRLIADIPSDATAGDIQPLKDALHAMGLRLSLQPNGDLLAYPVRQCAAPEHINHNRPSGWPPRAA